MIVAIAGTIVEKMDKQVLETKFRHRILERAAAAGLTRAELSEQLIPSYKSLRKPW